MEGNRLEMPELTNVTTTLDMFLADKQGRTFADVANDSERSFERVLAFFSDENRQRRMEESEIHHDRPALAGVVRELESNPDVERYLMGLHHQKSKRFRQAVGLVVRMIMEGRGWKKTGRKGSLGVRAPKHRTVPFHNTGGLAFWFIRAERYERIEGMPFKSVQERGQNFTKAQSDDSKD